MATLWEGVECSLPLTGIRQVLSIHKQRRARNAQAFVVLLNEIYVDLKLFLDLTPAILRHVPVLEWARDGTLDCYNTRKIYSLARSFAYRFLCCRKTTISLHNDIEFSCIALCEW